MNEKNIKKIVPIALFGSVIISNLSAPIFAKAGERQEQSEGFDKKIEKLDPVDDKEEIKERKRKSPVDNENYDEYLSKRSLVNQVDNQDKKIEKLAQDGGQEDTKMEEIDQNDELYDIDSNFQGVILTKEISASRRICVGGGLKFKIVRDKNISKTKNDLRVHEKAVIIGIDTEQHSLKGDSNKTLKEINVSKIIYNNKIYDVTEVEATALYRCTNIEKVILPCVETIGNGAFPHCEKIKEIYLPKLGYMGSDNFLSCSSLKKVTLSCVLFAEDIKDYNAQDIVFDFVGEGIEDYNVGKYHKSDRYKKLIYRLNHQNKTVNVVENIDDRSYLIDYNTDKLKEIVVYKVKYKVNEIISCGYVHNNLIYKLNHTKRTADILDVVDKSKLTSNLDIPGSVNIEGKDYDIKMIAVRTFSNCKDLEEVTIGEGIEEIDHEVFRSCSNLKRVILPNSLKKLGDEVFAWCGLERLVLPTETTDGSIKEWYYWDSSNGIENLLDDAVVKDTKNDIDYTDGSVSSRLYKKIINGVKYNVTPKGAVVVGYDKDTIPENLAIPEKVIIDNEEHDVIKIGESAFGTCNVIKSVKIPKSIRKIDAYAFFGCEFLTDVKIAEGVKTIESNSFQDCLFEDIEIPNSVTFLGEETFLGCENLKNVKIGTGLRNLLEWTFGGCEKLEYIVISDNLEFISKNVFKSDEIEDFSFILTESKENEKICKKIKK